MLLEASAGIANELAVASSSAAGEQPDANAGAASGWPPVSTMRPGEPRPHRKECRQRAWRILNVAHPQALPLCGAAIITRLYLAKIVFFRLPLRLVLLSDKPDYRLFSLQTEPFRLLLCT